jgi:hypothetical protein
MMMDKIYSVYCLFVHSWKNAKLIYKPAIILNHLVITVLLWVEEN